jgi:hypothetical protein
MIGEVVSVILMIGGINSDDNYFWVFSDQDYQVTYHCFFL